MRVGAAAITFSVIAGLAVALIQVTHSGSRHAAPHVSRTPSVGQASRLPGFDQVAFRIGRVGGTKTARPRCALLADTAARQQAGLMGRSDLGGYDAMVFQFPADSMVGFYNKDVPIALSIAWFNRAGAFISQAELAFCAQVCPTVRALSAYRYAIEVPAGHLAALGVGPGSTLQVGGGC